MSYGGTFEQAMIDQFGRPGMEMGDILSREFYKIPPQIHGYDF